MVIKASIFSTVIVPRLDDNVRTDPIQAPRAQGLGSEAFGAGLGQGITQGSRAAMAVIAEEKQRADRTATLDARTKLDQVEVDLLYHPEKGALAKRGSDSFSIEEPTLKAFAERSAEVENSLATLEQKQAFRLMAEQRKVEVDKAIQRHVFGEMKTYSDEKNKASLESTLNNVSMNYQDTERIEQERKFGQAVIMSDSDNKGKPPEYVKLRMAAWESKVHEAVIDKMMVSNAVAAKEYFTTNKEQILPTEAAKIEKTLKPLASKQQGMDTALEVGAYLSSSDDPAALRTIEDSALKEIRNRLKGDPDALNIAEVQLKQMASERKEIISAAREQAAAPIYKRMAEARLNGKIPKMSDIPKEEWAALVSKNPEEAGKIQTSLRQEMEHATDRARTESDRRETKATLDNLTTWGLLKTRPETLRDTNLDALLSTGKLSKTQYQDLITDQLSIKQGKGEHEAKILSDKAAVDVILHSVGIKDDPKSKDASAKYWKFQEALNGRMKLFSAENDGRKPKQEDVVKMARGLLGEVSQDVSFWPADKTVKVFDADISKVRVPSAERATIIRALQSNGRAATEDAIRRLYLEKQMRGVK